MKKLAKLNFQKLRSRYLVTSLPGKRWGDNGNSERLHFWALKSLQTVTTAITLKNTCLLGRKAMTNLDIVLKNRDVTLPTKVI